MKVYLAGPISGLTYGDAIDWREQATIELARANIVAFSPMRFKKFLDDGNEIHSGNYPNPLGTTRGIMTRDFFDVNRADLIFVNFLGTKSISIGTVMEVAWAYQLRKPVVIAAEANNPHVTHAMMQEAIGYRVDTLTEALAITRHVLKHDLSDAYAHQSIYLRR